MLRCTAHKPASNPDLSPIPSFHAFHQSHLIQHHPSLSNPLPQSLPLTTLFLTPTPLLSEPKTDRHSIHSRSLFLSDPSFPQWHTSCPGHPLHLIIGCRERNIAYRANGSRICKHSRKGYGGEVFRWQHILIGRERRCQCIQRKWRESSTAYRRESLAKYLAT